MKQLFGKQLGSTLCLLSVAAIWGGAFIFSKNALHDIGPFYFLFFRFGIAAIILAIFCGKRLKLIKWQYIKPSLIIGFWLFLGFATETIGLQYTSVANTAFISAFYVVLVPLLSFFFSRKISSLQIIMAIIAFCGLALFTLDRSFHINRGDILVLACAFCFSLHFLYVDRFTAFIDSVLLSFLQILVTCILCGICALIFEPPPQSFTPDVWKGLIYGSTLASAYAFFIQVWVQKILSPVQTSVTLTSKSLFGLLFGWLFMEEVFIPRQLVGGTILIFSIIAIIILPWWQAKVDARMGGQSLDNK